MGIRISEMEEATTFGADDYVPIVTNGTNKKALGQKIKDFIAGFFVSKSGDTMSGDLTVEKSNGDFVSKNPNITINTSANNGVTSSQTEGFMIKDSANNNITRFISVQETTGDVLAQIAAFNKKTDGTATNNYINVTIKKDGTSSYMVSDPAAFRSAIGACPFVEITYTGAGGSTSAAGIATLQNAVDALDNGAYLGIYKAGDVGLLLILKASDNYITIVRISYGASNTAQSTFRYMTKFNGAWGGWVS